QGHVPAIGNNAAKGHSASWGHAVRITVLGHLDAGRCANRASRAVRGANLRRHIRNIRSTYSDIVLEGSAKVSSGLITPRVGHALAREQAVCWRVGTERIVEGSPV